MTAKDYPSLWGFGTTKTFKIPVEHLDFKYIEKCSDIKHLEKILCVLRSGEEGYYPELTEFCEKRLKGLAPESRALRKDKPAATASSFTAEEWEKIDGDMKSWISEIKKEENKMHFHETDTLPALEDNLPPVRGSHRHLHVSKEKYSNSRQPKKKIPRDYAEWDKFDVEKECSKIDEDYKEKAVVNKSHLSKIETRIDTAGLTEKEKTFLATHEKEKGNEAFNSGDYEEAVMYYTRSISVLPTVAAYNNRAQAELKLQNWNSAFQDCEKVLELEPGNLKALLRRATTYKHQNKLREALEDLNEVLNVEPDNELARKTLSEVERDLKNSEAASKTQAKGKRMVIQEVENSEDEGGKDSRRAQEDGSGDKSKTSFLFWLCKNLPFYMMSWLKFSISTKILSPPNFFQLYHAGLKSQGNELFKSGQFAEAALKYSAAIAQLEPAGSGSADDLSILYSNRAACYLKEGNCSGCIQDCNRGAYMNPSSFSPPRLGGCPIDEKMFKTLKEEGNQCVKDKNYKDALSKYSECLKINNKECAIYTNRALCYLKLHQFEEAKQDCDRALQIDDGSVKAHYRRALAHKGLKDYQKSLNDLNKVLQLDSSIVEAKMELEEVTRFLNIKDNTTLFNKEKERRKIEIQEVSEGQEEEPGRTSEELSTDCPASENGDTTSGLPEYDEKLPITKPNNAYEFGQVINAISMRNDKQACAHLLTITEPKDLPMLLSNKLEGDTFLLLIQSLKNNLGKDPSLVYQHLLYLSKVERFMMMLTLISKGQKEQIEQLFDDLSDTPNKHFTLEDVQALKRKYEL
ncbi:sperm-associated antigen 1 [Leptonychotes weddellii]|uniref:Sperm-associated antigen 1 n=1 Tax=Leptonychotes weddellii TaxID=9713 RepID=A0A7F8RDW5_LEPWE|nr:sperm-associated antigen 1 [Leptonychotes weddellii]